MNKPKFSDLWANFPDHDKYASLEELYTWLGGAAAENINEDGFGPNGNTCASRMSVALNKSGAKIVPIPGVSTLGTADGSRIIFRVEELRLYLIHIFGEPLIDDTSPYNGDFVGKKGILAFTIDFDDASGHIPLWDGVKFREPEHDDYSTFVEGKVRTSKGELWEFT